MVATFQYKECLSKCGYLYYKDKTVMRLSYLYDQSLYTGKTASFYWDGPPTAIAGATILVPCHLCDMAYIVPMHVKPKFTYLLTPGTLSCRHVFATPLKIGHPLMKSTGAQFSNQLQWPDLTIDHPDGSSSYSHHGDMPCHVLLYLFTFCMV